LKSNNHPALYQTSLNIFQVEVFEKLINTLIANLFIEVETNKLNDQPKILKTLQVLFV